MRRLLLLGGILALAGCATAETASTPALTALAVLRDKDGKQVGTATLRETGGGVRILVTAHPLPPGPKAVHIHEAGECKAPDFVSAGGHFNPGGKKHGRRNPDGPHAGDLPNMTVGPDRAGELETTTAAVTLREGAPNSVFQPRATAVVIHAGPDDDVTDPAGNAGARIACGTIVRQ
jgi:Cu-Zn family superoxide dismutase